MNDHLRHGLVVCRCGTVVFDCGCRLKLVGSVGRCHACRAGRELLEHEGREVCGAAYELHLEMGLD